jgi:hypothetical protein
MSYARQRLLSLAAALVVSLHFVLAYARHSPLLLDLRVFAAGRAELPFQERALTAWLLRWVLRCDSVGLERELHRILPPSAGWMDLGSTFVLAMAFAGIMAAILATRASLERLTGDGAFAGWACLLVPYMAYFNYVLSPEANFMYPYDLPSLGFFCVCLWVILAQRFAVYYPVFFLACLNRETAVYLILFFGVLEGTRRGRIEGRLAAHLGVQVAIWTAVKVWMQHLYGHNPVEHGSGLFVIKFAQNLRLLGNPYHWPVLLSNFGFLLPVVIWRWRDIPHRGLRRCLPILALWFGPMAVVGVLIEIRIFGELISYVSLLAGLLVWQGWRGRAAVAARSSEVVGAADG